MSFEGYVYIQRISMRNKPEREKEREGRGREREDLKRIIDATRLFIYLANVMGHGLTSASRFLKRIRPKKTNARGNVENYSWRKISDPSRCSPRLLPLFRMRCLSHILSICIIDILPYRQRSSTLLESTPNNLEIIHMLHNLLHLFEQMTRLRSNILYGPNQPRWLSVLICSFMTLILVVRTVSKVTFWDIGIPVQ